MVNIGNMMKQAQQLQQKMAEAQEKLNTIEVEGISGGGLVIVTATAKGEIKRIILDDSIMTPKEKEITEDLKLNEMDDDGISEMMKPENMINMFQTINKTLTEKIGNNELDGNALLGEASNLMNYNDMMGNMMSMFQNMGNQQQTQPQQTQQSSGDQASQSVQEENSRQDNEGQKTTFNDHDGSEVKERLRKKLEKKKLKK